MAAGLPLLRLTMHILLCTFVTADLRILCLIVLARCLLVIGRTKMGQLIEIEMNTMAAWLRFDRRANDRSKLTLIALV